MKIYHATTPKQGASSSVQISDNIKLFFDFDTSSASFERSGKDLVVVFNNGSKITFADFFVALHDGKLPDLVLQDGTELASAVFLQGIDPDMDLSTAMGPVSSRSGLGEYWDEAGELVGGVDKLEKGSFISADSSQGPVSFPQISLLLIQVI